MKGVTRGPRTGTPIAGPLSQQENPMNKRKTAKDPGEKTGQNTKPCAADVRPEGELDGKNDSGPEPEVHGREIPPQ
jgi:hypothetical protein